MEGLKNKRGPSLWRLLLFVLVLALIAGGTSLFFGGRQDDHSTAMPRFEQYLRTNRIKDARTVYYEELFGDVLLQPEAEEKALAALDQVVEEHRLGQLDYETAETTVRALEQSGIFMPSKRIEEAYLALREANTQSLYYEAGNAAWAEGYYLDAATAYRQVRSGDPNYDAAQDSLKRSLNAYRDQIINDAKALQNKGEYLGSVQLLEEGISKLPRDEIIVDAYANALSTQDGRYRQFILDEARHEKDLGDGIFGLHILEAGIHYLESLTDGGVDLATDHALSQANIQTDIRLLRAEASRFQADLVAEANATVDQALRAEDYVEALKRLKEATDLLGKSTSLSMKQREIESKITYNMNLYMGEDEELLAIDPGLRLLGDWTANFGVDVVELYPAPRDFTANSLEIWWLLPGINLYETDVELEFNRDALELLGVDILDLELELRVLSGDHETSFIFDTEHLSAAIEASIDRQEIFRLEMELRSKTGELDSEIESIIREQRLVRLFASNSRFTNDGDLDALEDYESYLKEQLALDRGLEGARWRELGSLDQSFGDGNTELKPLNPLRMVRAVGLSGTQYIDTYLYSQDSRTDARWIDEIGIQHIKASVAWLDPDAIQGSLLNTLFEDGGDAFLAGTKPPSQLELLIRSGDRPLLRFSLDEDVLEEHFALTLPFRAHD